MRKDFKYTTQFSSTAKCAADKEQDKFLAVASLEAIKTLLPKNIDYDKNYDLLGFAGNGAVINRANKNGHVIDSKTAVAINQHFAYKPMDLEHNRSSIVGVILNTGFTTYGTNQLISEEESLACEGPFNIAIGGLVFRIVNPDFADLLENSSNPESLLYEAVSLSWEIGYNDYYINIGSPNLSEAEVVKDPKHIEELSKFLRMKGGENKLEDGTQIYQYIYGNDVQPLAYGFTTRPAAQVKGVITGEENNKKEEKAQESISHSITPNVNTISNMKNLNSLEQIFALTDSDLKEVSASSLTEVIKSAIKQANDKFVSQQEESKNATAEVKELREQIKELTTTFETSLKAQAKRDAQETFNSHMSLVDSEFTLTDADRKAVASQVSKLADDTQFEEWYANFSIFAAAKKKKDDDDKDDTKNDQDDDQDDSKASKKKSKADDTDDEGTASKKKKDDKEDAKAAIDKAVQEALAKATEDGKALNLGVDLVKSFKDKYKGAFGAEGIVLKK